MAPFFCEGIALIVFQIRATPREGDLFLFAVGDQHFIDKLPTVIGINPEDWKREEHPPSLDGSQHRLLACRITVWLFPDGL